MEISKRLRAVAEQVNSDYMADIGTDHAYIPIHLCRGGRVKRAIACDANAGPLERAGENVKLYGLTDKIELRLGDGLKPLKRAEVGTVVISGMGGRLMKEILSYDAEKTKSFAEFVLQPQSDIDELRKFLHTISFRIKNEQMLSEGGKFYVVISAVPGADEKYSEDDYLFGRKMIEKRDGILYAYINEEIEKQERILRTLETAGTNAAEERSREVFEKILKMKQVVGRE